MNKEFKNLFVNKDKKHSMIKIKTFIIAILMIVPVIGMSQNMINEMNKIMIRNVTVIDQSGETEDIAVSILMEEKKLELITRDKIALDQADIAFDAKGGFILGTIEVGSLASFLILDKDPRTNVDIILDTKSYSVFAVAKGEVVLNKLVRIDVDSENLTSDWQSYAPPPVALPLSYQNSRKWNVFRTKAFTAAFGGAIIMENTRWFSQDNTNEQQLGDLREFEGGSMRGFRAGLGGAINFKKPWSYFTSWGTRAFERGFNQGDQSEFVFYDYRIDIPVGTATLSMGKTKETFSISRLHGMIYEPAQQERASVTDGLLPARNVGIVMNDTFLNERMTWSAGVFNNWYEVDKSFSENPTVFTGRISALPYLSKDESNLFHLGIAGRYSNAAGGIRYKTKTEIYSGPISVDTQEIDDASSTFHYGLEMAWRKGPFILISEYIQSNVRSTTFNDPSFKGYYVVASYTITGEMRSYNKRSGTFRKLNVANGLNSGGWGELDVYTRWSSIDLNDKSIEGGEMNTFSLGLNWSPIAAIQVNVNYRYSTLERLGQKGSNNGFVTRLVFIL
jgi:phosphate-selective porin OprO/OprP